MRAKDKQTKRIRDHAGSVYLGVFGGAITMLLTFSDQESILRGVAEYQVVPGIIPDTLNYSGPASFLCGFIHMLLVCGSLIDWTLGIKSSKLGDLQESRVRFKMAVIDVSALGLFAIVSLFAGAYTEGDPGRFGIGILAGSILLIPLFKNILLIGRVQNEADRNSQ